MRDVNHANFGVLIAFILPGLVALWGVAPFSPTVQQWLSGRPDEHGITIAGFLYATLAALAAGMLASTLRWLLIDSLHYRTGIPRPRWNDGLLHERISAFEFLVENHYRFYQFHANGLIAVLFAASGYVLAYGLPSVGECLLLSSVCVLLWLGSRDTLRKFVARTELLLQQPPQNRATAEPSAPGARSPAAAKCATTSNKDDCS